MLLSTSYFIGKHVRPLYRKTACACVPAFGLIRSNFVEIKVKHLYVCLSVLPVCLSGRESPVPTAPSPAAHNAQLSVVWMKRSTDEMMARWSSFSPATFHLRAISHYAISFYWKTRALCSCEITRLKLPFSLQTLRAGFHGPNYQNTREEQPPPRLNFI